MEASPRPEESLASPLPSTPSLKAPLPCMLSAEWVPWGPCTGASTRLSWQFIFRPGGQAGA